MHMFYMMLLIYYLLILQILSIPIQQVYSIIDISEINALQIKIYTTKLNILLINVRCLYIYCQRTLYLFLSKLYTDVDHKL